MEKIVIGRSDYNMLASLGRAEALVEELGRATIVDDADVPENVVTMGVEFTYSMGGVERTGTLVYPADADISAGKISVLTPVGTALIGLSVGQVQEFEATNGREMEVEVISVSQNRNLSIAA